MEIDVKRVSDLARIRLSSEEMLAMERDLLSILRHAENLKEVDVSNVSPTFGLARPASSLLEADVPGPTLNRDTVLGLFPASKDGSALVPKEAPGETREGVV